MSAQMRCDSETAGRLCLGSMPIVKQIRRDGLFTLIWQAVAPGITVGSMAVPQALSYALLADLPPEYGLYASTFGLFAYCVFGSSPELSVGPVAMASILIEGVITTTLDEDATVDDKINIAAAITFIVGVSMMLFGLIGMGRITRLISQPVIAGFTIGAAILIGLSQVKYLFKIEVKNHPYPMQTVAEIFENIGDTDGATLGMSISCILFLLAMKEAKKRFPQPEGVAFSKQKWWVILIQVACTMNALMVVLVYTPLSALLEHYDVELKVVGSLPSGIKSPNLPDFSHMTGSAIIASIVISAIGFMESYAAGMKMQTVDRLAKGEGVNANQELFAIGCANLVASFFNGFTVFGSIGRTAVSANTGASSTFHGAITGCFVIFVLLVLLPAFEKLPYCALASIVIVAVAGLVDYQIIRDAWAMQRREGAVMLITILAVLGIGIQYGVLVGAGISLAVVSHRAALPHTALLGKVEKSDPDFAGQWRDATLHQNTRQSPGTIVLRVDAAIFFANCEAVKNRCLQVIYDYEELAKCDYEELAKKSPSATETEARAGFSMQTPAPDAPSDSIVHVPLRKRTTAAALEEGVTVTAKAALVHAKKKKKADAILPVATTPRVELHSLVLHLGQVDYVDISGVLMLRTLDQILRTRGLRFALSQPVGPVIAMLERAAAMHRSKSAEDMKPLSDITHRRPLAERTFHSIEAALKWLGEVPKGRANRTPGSQDVEADVASKQSNPATETEMSQMATDAPQLPAQM